MASDTDDPFTTTPRQNRETTMNLEDPPMLILPSSSPAQLKRTLQAHLSETRKRLEVAGQLGNHLVRQEKEIAARLQEVEESGELIDPELKRKLADLEKEYNEVGKETARALLTNKVMNTGGVSPAGNQNLAGASTTLQSTGSPSPSKLGVPPSRRQRNQPSRQHDLEFAAELGQSLIVEVRKLQALLAEREAALKDVTGEKANLELHAKGLEARLKSMDDSTQRFKEENWNLELQIQELHSQQSEQKDTEARMQANIALLEHEKNMVIKEFDDLKHQHARVTEEMEAKYKTHESEIGALRRNLTTSDSEKSRLQKTVTELQSELEASVKESMRLRKMQERQDAEDNRDPFDLSAPSDDTPDDSPPTSPTKHTPRHGQLEAETLKSSLLHAHRLIQNLRSNMHREKTEKNELKRLLQEARDELETARSGFSSPQVKEKREKRRRPDGTFRRPSRISLNLLGTARRSNDEIVHESPAVDDDWEEAQEDDSDARVRRTPGAYLSSVPGTDLEGDSTFETASERTVSDAFDTATETEPYRTRQGSSSKDYPTSADDSTETEQKTLRTLRPKSSALSARSLRPLRLSKLRQQSVSSTASTEEDEYDQESMYRYGSSSMELEDEYADGQYDDELLRTPSAVNNPRLKMRLNRARKGSRVTSDGNSMFNSNLFGEYSPSLRSIDSSPTSLNDSPRAARPSAPDVRKSLFAELGNNSPGMMSTYGDDDAEDDQETPTKKLQLGASLMPREMVDSGCMTEEPYPDTPILIDDSEGETSDRPSTGNTVINSSSMPGFGTIFNRKPELVPPKTGPEMADAGVQSEEEEKPVLNDTATQSEPAELSEIGTQSEQVELIEMSTQSDNPELTEVGTQSDKAELNEMGTQSEKTELFEVGTQADEPKPVLAHIGTQAEEVKPVLAHISTQAEEVQPVLSHIGTQAEEIRPILSDMSTQSEEDVKPVLTHIGTQSEEEVKPILSHTSTQSEAEIKPVLIHMSTQSEQEIKPILSHMGTQSDEEPKPILPTFNEMYTQSETPILGHMSTQSDAPNLGHMSTQSDEIAVSPTFETGTQSDDIPLPQVSEAGTQFDPKLEKVSMPDFSMVLGQSSETVPVEEPAQPLPEPKIVRVYVPAEKEPTPPFSVVKGGSVETEPVEEPAQPPPEPKIVTVFVPAEKEPVPAFDLVKGISLDTMPVEEKVVVPSFALVSGAAVETMPVEETIPPFALVTGETVETAPVEESIPQFALVKGDAVETTPVEETIPPFALVAGDTVETAPVEEAIPHFALVAGDAVETAPVEEMIPPFALVNGESVDTAPVEEIIPPFALVNGKSVDTAPVEETIPPFALVNGESVDTAPVEETIPPFALVNGESVDTAPVEEMIPPFALVNGEAVATAPIEEPEPEPRIVTVLVPAEKEPIPPFALVKGDAVETAPIEEEVKIPTFALVKGETVDTVPVEEKVEIPTFALVKGEAVDTIPREEKVPASVLVNGQPVETEPFEAKEVTPTFAFVKGGSLDTLPVEEPAPAPSSIAFDFSPIVSESTAPVTPELSSVLPVTVPIVKATDNAVSSDEDTSRKVSEATEETLTRQITPTPSMRAAGFFSSIFGARKTSSESEAVETPTKKTMSVGSMSFDDAHDDKLKEKDSPVEQRLPMVPMSDQSIQTELSSDFFDKIINDPLPPKRYGGITAVSQSPSIRDRAVSPSLRSHTSLESMGRGRGRMSSDGTRIVSGGSSIGRPESSGSMLEQRMQCPPLPEDHQEQIAEAREKIGAPAEPYSLNSMGPPPLPTQKGNVSFRPRTPGQSDQYQRRPETPAGSTSKTPRFSATRSEISSPGSRRSSISSSFATELDDRFNMQTDGYQRPNGSSTDPTVIQAITQTMIGEYLWKYTRNTGRGTMSHNRHKRFFWIHPYTRTLYWSDRDPQSAGRAELRAKSVAIEAVRVVNDDNPSPPGLHRKSLVVITPGRTLKFTAPTSQRHETWFNALSYLLLRDGQEDVIEDSTTLNEDDLRDYGASGSYSGQSSLRHTVRGASSVSSFRSRATRDSSPGRNASSLSSRRLEKERNQGSLSRLSSVFRPGSTVGTYSSRNDNSVYGISEADSEEDLQHQLEREEADGVQLENVRACCDGKHDVGTLSRKGGKKALRNRAAGSHGHSHTHTHTHG